MGGLIDKCIKLHGLCGRGFNMHALSDFLDRAVYVYGHQYAVWYVICTTIKVHALCVWTPPAVCCMAPHGHRASVNPVTCKWLRCSMIDGN